MRGVFFADDPPPTADVVIIGGGIVGAACAEALARNGVGVALIERGQLASGSSGACEGDVLLSDKVPGPELELGKAGQALYDELAARLPIDIEIEHKGALILNLAPDGAARTAEYAAQMRAAGVRAEAVTGDEARELDPELSLDVAGGAFFPDDLQVWPMKVVIGLALAAHDAGAKIVCNTTAEAIEVEHERVVGVRTSRGVTRCDTVVVAAGAPSPPDPLSVCNTPLQNGRGGDVVGADSDGVVGGNGASRDAVTVGGHGGPPLLAQCGVHLPLFGRKGQIVVTDPRPGLIRRKLFDAGYADTVHSATASLQISTVLETTRRGNVLIGSSRSAEDRDRAARLSVSAAMIAQAVKFVPALRDVRVIRTYAGFRPFLPDSLPAIGRTQRLDGLILATGHEGSGIILGPITGELVAEIYANKTPRVDLTAFDPDRFVGVQAGVGQSEVRAR